MRKILRFFFSAFLLSIIVWVVNPKQAEAVSFNKSTSDVYWFSESFKVKGASSYLATHDRGAYVKFDTSQLTPDDAVTLWWVVFNNPASCTQGQGGYHCGEGDLTDPDVQASVLHASGKLINRSGSAHFTSYLPINNINGALFGPGLLNPETADIHFVVRTHGSKITELLYDQLHTFDGGCNNSTASTGSPGPNTCEDIQFAVHEN